MTALYAETSAVLSWLLGEPPMREVRKALRAAEVVVTSDLTLIECDRAFLRLRSLGVMKEGEAADRQARLRAALSKWTILRLSTEIVDRARRPFPAEPIRSLDALHLASALVARSSVSGLALLSLDDRIRKSARELGFTLLPK